jgi:hypothetical protein
MKGTLRRTAIAVGLATVLIGSASCGDTSLGKSPSILIIDQLLGANTSTPNQFGGTMQSDVLMKGSIFEDLGQVGLRMTIKDLGNPGAESGPSPLNQILINRYRVAYRRADGRNMPGVDVPYPFDGAITLTVTESAQLMSFTIVRVQAKLEAPLSLLVNHGGAGAISTIADVTFYGHDLAGNAIQQTGSIGINFADWADPE